MDQPRVAVIVQSPRSPFATRHSSLRSARYVEAVRRAGAKANVLDEHSDADQVARVLSTMDGLLLTGGADLSPSLYAHKKAGSIEIEVGRDALERRAWDAATDDDLPVLGICRGLQAINVFSGGSLIQDVEGHDGPGYPEPHPTTHPISLVPETQLAAALTSEELEVNSYHHQGIVPSGLASNLTASAFAKSPIGPLVEGLEDNGRRFVVAVQTHPERTESTPEAFANLFAVFADACRQTSRLTTQRTR